MGPRTFQQCAGFLRVRGGSALLDSTAVHPESYAAAKALILEACGGERPPWVISLACPVRAFEHVCQSQAGTCPENAASGYMVGGKEGGEGVFFLRSRPQLWPCKRPANPQPGVGAVMAQARQADGVNLLSPPGG